MRRDIAICTRLLVDAGILEYSGHVSSRLPSGDAFLIHPRDDVRSGLKPPRLLIVGLDGEVIEEDGLPPLETPIHAEVYKASPEVGAIAHFHHDTTTMFSIVENWEIVPVKNHADRWENAVPIHSDPSHIATVKQGRALVRTLGNANAVLLRGHGEVVVAENIKALFADVIHFVENAQSLAHASLLGDVEPLSKKGLDNFQAAFDREIHAWKLWSYFTIQSANSGSIPMQWVDDRLV